MGDVQDGPELSHTTGHQVRVCVERGTRGQRGQAGHVLSRESLQIGDLPSRDGGEHVAYFVAIRILEGVQAGQDLAETLEESTLGRLRLAGCAGGSDGPRVDERAGKGVLQGLEVIVAAPGAG